MSDYINKKNIVITGRRNTGKSSLINCILGQNKAVVSPVPGTTTDPVRKSYELPGVASLVLIDTAGIDDEGELGKLRIAKTQEAIQQADAAILVITDNLFGPHEERLIQQFQTYKLPFLILHNQSDLTAPSPALCEQVKQRFHSGLMPFSTLQPDHSALMKAIGQLVATPQTHTLLDQLVHPGQVVLLITPIDSEAPAGRMILPQVQMMREILDRHCIGIILQPEEIPAFFSDSPLKPDIVITDSQVFGKVAPLIPDSIPLTSFSILLARQKGHFEKYLEGTPYIERLQDGDRILMLESCSHHVSCEDIGRVKIPALLQKYTGKQLQFDFIAGLDCIRRPFSNYALIVQCGGCMVTSRQLHNRLQPAIEAGIPVTNYGMTIAYIQGIFDRTTSLFRPSTCRPNQFF